MDNFFGIGDWSKFLLKNLMWISLRGIVDKECSRFFLFVSGYKTGKVSEDRGGLEGREIHIYDGDEISEG